MTDILTVLRDHNYIGQEGIRWDAADEIESLRAQLASARKALEPFAEVVERLSRAHLNGGPDDEKVIIEVGKLRAAAAVLKDLS